MGVAVCFRNSKLAYGITAIVTHWLSAIVVIGLFAVGVDGGVNHYSVVQDSATST